MSKQFRIKALHVITNRKRTIILRANNIEDLTGALLNQGFREPYDIEELKPEPATERQLNYAKILNINIPFEVSKSDLSALIDKSVENDGEPNPDLLEYATGMGFSFSKYIGNKRLYNLIYENLTSTDKLAFFIFCVYRYLSDDRAGNLSTHLFKEKIYDYAALIKLNPKIVKSAFNYRGDELRFFGTLKFSDGYETIGGSINTMAYKEVSKFVSETFGTPKTKTLKVDSKSNYKPNTHSGESKSGCMTKAAMFILIFALVALLIIM